MLGPGPLSDVKELKVTKGVFVPPPAVYLLCWVVGYVIDWLLPIRFAPHVVLVGTGIALVVASIVLITWALVFFKRYKTSFDGRVQASTLITAGPFEFSRNPAYLAALLLYLGGGLVVGSLWIYALVVPAFLYTHWTIVKEEARLEAQFGDDYTGYRDRVRRWI